MIRHGCSPCFPQDEVVKAAKEEGKGVLDGVKGAATSVGKALHIVADSAKGAECQNAG